MKHPTDDQPGAVEVTWPAEGIAQVTFAHPAQNALPGYLLADLAHAFTGLARDERARVIVLSSAGSRTFCAGANFDEFKAIRDAEGGKQFFMGFARVINAMRQCPKFIVGRVQGKAIGGGVGLAAATDYCLASHSASVKLSELALGIGPFVVGPAVARKLGQAGLAELAIDAAHWRPAAWAREKGLFAELFYSLDTLDQAVHDLASRLAHYNPEAMAALKATFWSGTDDWSKLLEERAEQSGRMVLSAYTRQALEAFEQRKKSRPT